MTDVTIPDKAWKAAKREVERYLGLTIHPEVARAACLAMINSWPGMTTDGRWTSPYASAVYKSEIILPLPDRGVFNDKA